jgi:perosamine synthetase
VSLAEVLRRGRGGAGGILDRLIPRCVGPIGGTSTLADCLAAAAYIASPGKLIHGPAIAEYESAFARKIGVRYAFSFSAGRVGLYAVLHGLGTGPGDEVLVQVPTHVVVANAIRYTGARPVYVDCDLDTYNIDLHEAEKRITARTRVLVLQHTFGNPVDLDRAMELAARHHLDVVEDCVHALGSTYRGRTVGSIGRASFFSTEETKTISSTMGGMVATDDPGLAARIRSFQAGCSPPSAAQTVMYLLKFIAYHMFTEPHVHGATRTFYELAGRRHPLPRATSPEEMRGAHAANYRQLLSNAQAAIALRQLRRLDENLLHRRAVVHEYGRRLAELGYATPETAGGANPAFVRYPTWVADRTRALRASRPHALLGNWFTSVLEEAVSPADCGYEPGSCPRAEAAARHLINLPTNPRVTESDVEAIVSSLAMLATSPERS